MSNIDPDKEHKTFEPPVPGLDFLARFEVELGTLVELGEIGTGRRRDIPIIGGKFEGPRLQGRILNGGADWQLVQHDGLSRIDTRYSLQTDDGALINIATRGIRRGPPEIIAALSKGKPVDPAKYYFRFTAHFETGASKYTWLNKSLSIGAGVRLANSVIYNAYLVT
jgi:hypothetical protein